jgi:hypothetical protein
MKETIYAGQLMYQTRRKASENITGTLSNSTKSTAPCRFGHQWTSMGIRKLKQAGSAFHMYLQAKRVYINKAQLGTEEGVTLGWMHQAHPAFCFQEDIKERLRELMGDEHKELQYDVRLTTTGVTMQIAKSTNLVAADFHASMAEKWQKINVKNGGTLFGKNFIPFGKEEDKGDVIMMNAFQQQNKFLAETKQRIVYNLRDVEEIIEIALGEDVNMDPAGITLCTIPCI